MRTKMIAALCGALAFATGAVAQDDQTQGGDQEQGQTAPSETEGQEVAPSGEQPQEGQAPSGKETAPGEVHTVVKGDTLWDLSQRYLGSPWYWPKVWSYNPEIANPHWIYPGNQVRFFPTGEEVPSRVEVGNAPNEVPSEQPAEEEAVAPSDLLEGEEQSVRVSQKIGYTPPKASRLTHQGIATEREIDEAGRIEASSAESLMLSFPDNVYVRFKSPGAAKVGDRYVIFRRGEVLEHPITGSKVGYLTYFLGTMKVVTVGKSLVTAQIQPDTWDEVNRNDLVGPYSEKLSEQISPRPNEREMKGYVVSAEIPYLALLGEHHVVVIDKGSADGVQPGNTFTVVRQIDPTASVDTFLHPALHQDSSLPTEDIGTCMAVDVKDRLSMCLLTRSILDLEKGDRVEMRVKTQPTASR